MDYQRQWIRSLAITNNILLSDSQIDSYLFYHFFIHSFIYSNQFDIRKAINQLQFYYGTTLSLHNINLYCHRYQQYMEQKQSSMPTTPFYMMDIDYYQYWPYYRKDQKCI